MSSARLLCGSRQLQLSRPLIMGVLNVTPDSFSDGGRYLQPDAALARVRKMLAEGADLIDIGGESTRPGAEAVGLDEELRRVIPLVEVIANELDVVVSVDTSKPEVMRAAIAAGAGIINDVNALRAPGALDVLAEHPDVAVILMHMQGEPRTMQQNPHYVDVVGDVRDFLAERIAAALTAGISADQIVVDPGIGFGKTLAHNLALLNATGRFVSEFSRVLIGVSRKSMFAQLLGDRPPEQRVAASVQTAMLAAQAGAAILRVHDVAETAEALRLLHAIQMADSFDA